MVRRLPAFEEWLSQFCAAGDGTYPPTVTVKGEKLPIKMLLSWMDQNHDPMPDSVCEVLNLPVGSEYALGAQVIRTAIESLAPRS